MNKTIRLDSGHAVTVLCYEDGFPEPAFCAFAGYILQKSKSNAERQVPRIDSETFVEDLLDEALVDKAARSVKTIAECCELLFPISKMLGVSIYQAMLDGVNIVQSTSMIAHCCLFEKPFLEWMSAEYRARPWLCSRTLVDELNAGNAKLVSKATFEIRMRSIRRFLWFVRELPSMRCRTESFVFMQYLDQAHLSTQKSLDSIHLFNEIGDPYKQMAARVRDERSTASYIQRGVSVKPSVKKKEKSVFKREYNAVRNEVIRELAVVLGFGKGRLARLNRSDFIVSVGGGAVVRASATVLPKDLSEKLLSLMEGREPTQGDPCEASDTNALFVNSTGRRLTPVAISKILERNKDGEQ